MKNALCHQHVGRAPVCASVTQRRRPLRGVFIHTNHARRLVELAVASPRRQNEEGDAVLWLESLNLPGVLLAEKV